MNDLQSLPGLENHKAMTTTPVTPRDTLQGLALLVEPSLRGLLFCLDTEMTLEDTAGRNKRDQMMSQRHSQLLRMAIRGHNLNKSLEGSFHREEGAEEISPCTSECNCAPSQFGCPTLGTTDVETVCSQITCHQKLLEISGLRFTQQ